MASRKLVGIAAGAMLGMGMVGCQAIAPIHLEAVSSIATVRGRVVFPIRTTQATLGEVANAATVSLIDASTGNTVSSSLTDASGSFVLTFNNFTPVAGTPYVLEAVKGLSAGGSANRVGASAARLRTLLFWNNGWQSLTNSTPGTGIVVSAATTAIATISSLKQLSVSTMLQLVNSVSGASFTDGKGGLSSSSDFTPVLTLVSNAMALDQDPVGQIAYDPSSGTYALPIGVPGVASITPTIGTPGQTLTVHGAYFDPNPGRLSFWFGPTPVSTYSVSADRTSVTVTIPSSAYSSPFTMQQPSGVVQTLSPFYLLHGTVGTLVGNGNAAFADGTGINAEFSRPWQLNFGSDGYLYVGDQLTRRVRRVSLAGVVTTAAGNGISGYVNGAATSAEFNEPEGAVMDSHGNLFVSDWGNYRIREITPAGVVNTFVGNGSSVAASGTGTGASVGDLWGLAIDGQDNVYVAVHGGCLLQKVTPAGVVSTLAGNGVAGSLDGTGTSAEFNYPQGLCTDSAGNVYMTEHYRVRKITPTGIVSTFAGNGTPGLVNGATSSAEFGANLYGLAFDTQGNLLVEDGSYNCIRQISASGIVSTVAGSGVNGFQDGATSSAQFSQPTGVAVAPNGAVYVLEYGNNAIRVVMP